MHVRLSKERDRMCAQQAINCVEDKNPSPRFDVFSAWYLYEERWSCSVSTFKAMCCHLNSTLPLIIVCYWVPTFREWWYLSCWSLKWGQHVTWNIGTSTRIHEVRCGGKFNFLDFCWVLLWHSYESTGSVARSDLFRVTVIRSYLVDYWLHLC